MRPERSVRLWRPAVSLSPPRVRLHPADWVRLIVAAIVTCTATMLATWVIVGLWRLVAP